MLDAVSRKKEEILLFANINGTAYEDALEMTFHLKNLVSTIVDIVTDESIDPNTPKILTAIKHEIKKEEEEIFAQSGLDKIRLLILLKTTLSTSLLDCICLLQML